MLEILNFIYGLFASFFVFLIHLNWYEFIGFYLSGCFFVFIGYALYSKFCQIELSVKDFGVAWFSWGFILAIVLGLILDLILWIGANFIKLFCKICGVKLRKHW